MIMLKISLKTVVPSSFGAGLASYCLKTALRDTHTHAKSPRRARRSTSVHWREKVLRGASYFYGVGSVYQITKQTTVPSLYGVVSTSQHSNTALRAASARPQAPIHARPRTSSCCEKGSRRSRYSFTVFDERVISSNE